jgi:MFS superfamily sulfate permease-like transporter
MSEREKKIPPPAELKMLKNLRYDLPAGLVVFLVALPLCLGIALASGAPLFSGIISGIVGGIVVGAYSRAPLAVSGPAAGLTVIVLAAIERLEHYEVFLLAVVLAGVIQIILGFLRAGIIAHYFPSSVIKGMLAGIGLILIFKQIPHALGYDFDYDGNLLFFEGSVDNTFTDIIFATDSLHPGALIISLISLFTLIVWELPVVKKKIFFKHIPGALAAVVLAIFINFIFIQYYPGYAVLGNNLVSLPRSENFNEFVGFFTMPDFGGLSNPEVYITALTIAIVASLESLLSVEATDKLDPYKRITPTNRELKAQGVGNVISGLIGGLPLTAVIVRSSANISAGGRTRMSAIVHGILLFVCVFFIPGILNMIPLAGLAAVLLIIGYKLTTPDLYISMYKSGRDRFLPFIATIIAILMTDLLKGIGIGMAIAIFFILRNNYRFPYYFQSEKAEGEKMRINLSEEVSFLNKGSILLMLENLPEKSHVIIDGSNAKYIDYDVLEIIRNFTKEAPLKEIKVELIGIREIN